MNNIIQVHKLTKIYKIKQRYFIKKNYNFIAIDNISFSVSSGNTLAIIGASGSGKSTLAKILTLVNKPTFGFIKINNFVFDSNIKKIPLNIRKNIQIVFQSYSSSLNPYKKISNILDEPLILSKKFDYYKRKKLIIDILYQVGLNENFYNKYQHMLSGGQKQRIAIARAIILKPKLLILDEPVSSLDLYTQINIINLLKKIQKTTNITYIFISHNISIIKKIASNILIIKKGKIIESGTNNQIFNNPKNEYTKNLLNAIPKINFNNIKNRLLFKKKYFEKI